MKRLIKKRAAINPESYIPGYPGSYNHAEKDVQTINVTDIIGMTTGRHDEYDDNMQPIGQPDDRWQRIYERAQQDGNVDFAGPISVVKVPDEDKYFVYNDGNHRVSVAKALNIPTIQAKVVVLVPKGQTENADTEKQIEEAQNKIKELTNKLDEYKVQQEELWDDKSIPMDQKDAKFDEIEQIKQPMYTEVDELWAKIYELQNQMS